MTGIPHLAVSVYDPNAPESVCQEAHRITHGERNQDYGHPLDDWSRAAAIWSAILGVQVTPDQVGLCMIGVKLARQVHKPKRDNLVDIAGYADGVQRCLDALD